MALGFGLLSAQLRPGETDWTRAYDDTVRLAVEAERLGFTLGLDDGAPLRRRRLHALAPRGQRGPRPGDVTDRDRHRRHPRADASPAAPRGGRGDRPAAEPRSTRARARARLVGGRVRRARRRHAPSRRGDGGDPPDPAAGVERRAVHPRGIGLPAPDAGGPSDPVDPDPDPHRRRRRAGHPPRRPPRGRHLLERAGGPVPRAGRVGARRARAGRTRPVDVPVHPLLDPAARRVPGRRARPLPRCRLGA